jgi:hypothetical protein
VGFEPTISVLERAKTVRALDRAATAIGSRLYDIAYYNTALYKERNIFPSAIHFIMWKGTRGALLMSVKKEICKVLLSHIRGVCGEFCDYQQIYFQIGRIYTFSALLNTGKWIWNAVLLAVWMYAWICA